MSDLDKKSLAKLTKAELAEKVKSLKLKAGSKATKDKLITLILGSQEESVKPAKATDTVKAVKTKETAKKSETEQKKDPPKRPDTKEEKELVISSSKNNQKQVENHEKRELPKTKIKKETKRDEQYISEGYTTHSYSHFER